MNNDRKKRLKQAIRIIVPGCGLTLLAALVIICAGAMLGNILSWQSERRNEFFAVLIVIYGIMGIYFAWQWANEPDEA